MIARGVDWELRLGTWQAALSNVESVDAVICDPPFDDRTHMLSVHVARYDSSPLEGTVPQYAHWTSREVDEFVASWSPRCRGWMVALTSSDLISAWQAAYRAHDRYSFAPVACVMRGMTVRLGGDGPSSWTVYAMVARPKTRAFSTWGTLPGAYVGVPSREASGGRGKPHWLMSALVRDYTRAGDLICDPFTGWGSTLRAAISLGRRGIGSEMDDDAFTEAQRRLARPVQGDLFATA